MEKQIHLSAPISALRSKLSRRNSRERFRVGQRVISEMKFKSGSGKVSESERAAGNGGGGDRKVVVVGVKLERRSRELLTWSLMKVAQPGDLVIALHVVLHASSGEQSSLLSLLKTFDSVLSVYEGFCHLKQVDLKLKVSRGSSVRKTLIEEAKLHHGATVIVGTSKNHPTILSLTSVAKHCARKLSHDFAVVSVDNGNIVFQRKATVSDHGIYRTSSCRNPTSRENHLALGDVDAIRKVVQSWRENKNSLDKHVSKTRSAMIKRYFGCGPTSKWSNYPCDLPKVESCIYVSSDSLLGSVPCPMPEPDLKPKPGTDQELDVKKQGRESDKASKGKISLAGRFSRSRLLHSAMRFDPNEKKEQSTRKENTGENGRMLPGRIQAFSVPKSPVHGMKPFAKQLDSLHAKYLPMCKLFKYKELLAATSGFLPERMIGRGGSSYVYRGRLSGGKEVAVKVLKSSEEVLKEFIAEIEIVTTISHKNIISLLGYCIDYESPILVYDLLPRGSLEENLHGPNKYVSAFGWVERYKVAFGVAEALNHLHSGTSEPVIHRDIKSSNILLAEDFEPQLADFGLATWASTASSFTSCSNVAGTFGYLAPEYFMHGKVTEKIDAYAFGVVLLELLSGRKPIDHRNTVGRKNLVMWANPILKAGKISHLLDDRLGSDHYAIERMALAATLCIRRASLFRPRFSIVLKILQGDPEITKWAKQQINTGPDYDILDGETSPKDIQSHLNTAFLDLEDDTTSVSSTDPSVSVEDYLKGKWSSLPSFS